MSLRAGFTTLFGSSEEWLLLQQSRDKRSRAWGSWRRFVEPVLHAGSLKLEEDSVSDRIQVEAPAKLLEFLKDKLAGWRPGTLKERLRLGCIRVNGETITQFDHTLEPGDSVEVDRRNAGTRNARKRPPFPVLHEDDDLIAIDKPAGLLSVSSAREKRRTALAKLRDWLAQSS